MSCFWLTSGFPKARTAGLCAHTFHHLESVTESLWHDGEGNHSGVKLEMSGKA